METQSLSFLNKLLRMLKLCEKNNVALIRLCISMEKKYTTPYGLLECFRKHVIFHLSAVDVNESLAAYIIELLNGHYIDAPYVFISKRDFVSKVTPGAYKFINPKHMVGLAIVSEEEQVRELAIEEMDLFSGAFCFFKTIDEAVDWASTVVRTS